jgi:single-strand DNA-binding protein
MPTVNVTNNHKQEVRRMNQAILTGNVGTAPELKYTGSGTALTRFRMATNEYYKNSDGERVTKTTWHTIVLWARLAEVAAEILNVGDRVEILGSIENRSYENGEGQTVFVSEIKARTFDKVGGRSQASDSDDESEEVTSDADVTFAPDDDFPF